MIPKIIHQIWHEPVYDGAHGTPQSWKDRNPGWDYRNWAFTELSRFVEEEFPQQCKLWTRESNLQPESDVGRFLLLSRFGHCPKGSLRRLAFPIEFTSSIGAFPSELDCTYGIPSLLDR